jgi:hypothetical protein
MSGALIGSTGAKAGTAIAVGAEAPDTTLVCAFNQPPVQGHEIPAVETEAADRFAHRANPSFVL